MKIFKTLMLTCFMTTVVGCAAALVPASWDPTTKIRQGYALLQQGRNLPAEKLFKQALEMSQEKKDRIIEATALMALGDVYRSTNGAVPKENVTNYKLSQQSYLQAVPIWLELDRKKIAADCYLRTAMASYSDKKDKEACEYLKKAESTYKASKNPQDTMDAKLEEGLINIASYKKSAGCLK
jgi:tetratricopeptide (TPR) repeat protein